MTYITVATNTPDSQYIVSSHIVTEHDDGTVCDPRNTYCECWARSHQAPIGIVQTAIRRMPHTRIRGIWIYCHNMEDCQLCLSQLPF